MELPEARLRASQHAHFLRLLLATLIAISSGMVKVENLGVPTEVGQRLMACYDELGEE